jgi:hypothetical protein
MDDMRLAKPESAGLSQARSENNASGRRNGDLASLTKHTALTQLGGKTSLCQGPFNALHRASDHSDEALGATATIVEQAYTGLTTRARGPRGNLKDS